MTPWKDPGHRPFTLMKIWADGFHYGLDELKLGRLAPTQKIPQPRGKVNPRNVARVYEAGIRRAIFLARARWREVLVDAGLPFGGGHVPIEKIRELEDSAAAAGEGYAALYSIERPDLMEEPERYVWVVSPEDIGVAFSSRERAYRYVDDRPTLFSRFDVVRQSWPASRVAGVVFDP
jgi:hypothetical protein